MPEFAESAVRTFDCEENLTVSARGTDIFFFGRRFIHTTEIVT